VVLQKAELNGNVDSENNHGGNYVAPPSREVRHKEFRGREIKVGIRRGDLVDSSRIRRCGNGREV
jgi:hypothetical protein